MDDILVVEHLIEAAPALLNPLTADLIVSVHVNSLKLLCALKRTVDRHLHTLTLEVN